MMEAEFFQSIAITLIGIFGSVICVILGWYLKKRETCNRRKEDLQEKQNKTLDSIDKRLGDHIIFAENEVKRLGHLEIRVDNIKEKNDLIE